MIDEYQMLCEECDAAQDALQIAEDSEDSALIVQASKAYDRAYEAMVSHPCHKLENPTFDSKEGYDAHFAYDERFDR